MKIFVHCPNGHVELVDDSELSQELRCRREECGLVINPPGAGQDGPPSTNRDPPFTVDAILTRGWQTLGRHYGALLGATLLYFLAIAALVIPTAVGAGLLEQSDTGSASHGLFALGLVATVLLAPLLFARWLYAGVSAARAPLAPATRTVGILERQARIFAVYYVILLALIISMMPLCFAFWFAHWIDPHLRGPGIPIAAIAGSVAIVAYLYVLIRLGFALQVCIDYELGVSDSIKLSLRLTRKSWGTLFVLALILWLICAATAMCLYLPYFFVGLPLVSGTWGVAYTMAVSRLARAAEWPGQPCFPLSDDNRSESSPIDRPMNTL